MRVPTAMILYVNEVKCPNLLQLLGRERGNEGRGDVGMGRWVDEENG